MTGLSFASWFLSVVFLLVSSTTTMSVDVLEMNMETRDTDGSTDQKITTTMLQEGVNPDPPPFDGNVVIDGNNDNSIIKIYNIGGSIVFRKELTQSKNNLVLTSPDREWLLLRSVQGLDNVIEVDASRGFYINQETGADNQRFWFDAGFLRNKAFPGKVVAMVAVIGSSNYGLQLEDETEGIARHYWIYNTAKRTIENGADGRYVIQVKGGDFSPGSLVDVHKPSGQLREEFNMPRDPDARELEILDIVFDIENAVEDFVPVSLYHLYHLNISPIESTIKVSQEEIESTVTSETFYWEKTYVVGPSFTLSLGIPKLGLGGEIQFGPKVTKTVGSNSETENTEERIWGLEAPITVPADSEVVFQMSVNEGKLLIPMIGNMRKGADVWQEPGMYEGVNFFGVHVSKNVTDLKFVFSENDEYRVP